MLVARMLHGRSKAGGVAGKAQKRSQAGSCKHLLGEENLAKGVISHRPFIWLADPLEQKDKTVHGAAKQVK